MLKSIEQKIYSAFYSILNYVLPERTDFSLVKNLDFKTINSLPKPPEIEGFDWIHPLFHYKNDKVKAIVWELKYKENTLTLEHIGKILYEEIVSLTSDILTFDNDAQFLLIPVPISPERRSERGFNQSEYIAKSILENDSSRLLLYAPQWFEKIKETSRQSHSESKEERMKNLIGCFQADPRVESKYIILIDDVVTTGSTLEEARKTLLNSGAKEVYAFTIAH